MKIEAMRGRSRYQSNDGFTEARLSYSKTRAVKHRGEHMAESFSYSKTRGYRGEQRVGVKIEAMRGLSRYQSNDGGVHGMGGDSAYQRVALGLHVIVDKKIISIGGISPPW